MAQVRILGKGARITGGLFCLLFLLHTAAWVAYDIAEQGIGPAWTFWTTGAGDGLSGVPATSSADLGLGLLQLVAVWAALTASRTAGGALAVATALTFAFRLPVVWHVLFHLDDDPDNAWYAVSLPTDDNSLEVGGFSSAWVAIFAAILGIVLLASRRPWPGPAPAFPFQPPMAPMSQGFAAPQPPRPPLPEDPPTRPTRAAAAVTAAVLGAIALCDLGWNLYVLNDSDTGTWVRFLTGKGVLPSVLAVAPAWQWLSLAALCGTGAVLAATRRLPARGFALALAAYLLPQAVAYLWPLIDAGAFFELGGDAPGAELLNRAQTVLEVLGPVAIIALTVRPGEPVAPSAYAPTPAPPPAYGWGRPAPVDTPPPGYGYGYGQQPPQQPGRPPQGTFGAPPVM